MLKFNVLGGVLLAAVSFVAPAADAALITVSTFFQVSGGVSTGNRTTPGTSSTTRGAALFLPGFDLNLGTLTSVNLRFTSSWTLRSSFSIRDPSTGFFHEENVSGSGRAAHTLTMDLFDPNGGARSQSFTVFSGCSDDDGFCFDGDSRTGSFDASLSVSGIPLSAFLAPDTIQVRATDRIQASVDICRDDEDLCSEIAESFWNGRIFVDYFFTEPPPAAPEPGTGALLGLGLAALGLRRRLRLRKGKGSKRVS